jgi:hypothetical protein
LVVLVEVFVGCGARIDKDQLVAKGCERVSAEIAQEAIDIESALLLLGILEIERSPLRFKDTMAAPDNEERFTAAAFHGVKRG